MAEIEGCGRPDRVEVQWCELCQDWCWHDAVCECCHLAGRLDSDDAALDGGQ